MSDKTTQKRQAPRLLRGEPVPMPNYRYQKITGFSGSISAQTDGNTVRRFEELGNFVLDS